MKFINVNINFQALWNASWTAAKLLVQTFAETITFTKTSVKSWATGNSILGLNASKEEIEYDHITRIITDAALITYLETEASWNGTTTSTAALPGEKGKEGQRCQTTIDGYNYLLNCITDNNWTRSLLNSRLAVFQRSTFKQLNRGNVTGAVTIDLRYSTTRMVLTGNTTISFSNMPTDIGNYILEVWQDATGSRTLAFSAGTIRGTVIINPAANSLTDITLTKKSDGKMQINCNTDTPAN